MCSGTIGTSWQTREPKRTRPRSTRTGTSTPIVPLTNAPYQAPVAPVPLPPQVPVYSTPLPSTPQAMITTYPSRLRTGATLLMQPIIAAPSASTFKVGRAGKRINYAEAASGDEDMDVDIGGREGESDDSDFLAGGGVRSSVRREGSRSLGTYQPSQLQAAKGGLDQSYLGMIPPTRFITSKPAQPTRHEHS